MNPPDAIYVIIIVLAVKLYYQNRHIARLESRIKIIEQHLVL